jgi:rare lipoprotein A (peptidoglycan hydrolase)
MNDRTKSILVEIAAVGIVALIIGCMVAVFYITTSRVDAWSSAQVEAFAPEVEPAVNAVRAIVEPPAPSPGEHLVEIVHDENGVTTMTYEDGSVTIFGTASWYDYTFDPGADFGRPCYKDREDCWTEDKDVAAMRDIPRGRPVTVTNLNNGKSVDLVITDFGPSEEEFPGRIIDLSSHAFASIADPNEGIVEVKVEWGK